MCHDVTPETEREKESEKRGKIGDGAPAILHFIFMPPVRTQAQGSVVEMKKNAAHTHTAHTADQPTHGGNIKISAWELRTARPGKGFAQEAMGRPLSACCARKQHREEHLGG